MGSGLAMRHFVDLALVTFEVYVAWPSANKNNDALVDTIDCKVDGSARAKTVGAKRFHVQCRQRILERTFSKV
jgi:hypothetical protein